MPDATPPAEIAALRLACGAWLNGHRPRRSAREVLLHLADLPEAALPLDVYGEGEAIRQLESQVAGLLRKPRTILFHKGVAAQLAALAAWTGGVRDARVALHRKSHIEVDEQQAHEHVLGLRGQRLGRDDAPFGVDELVALAEPPLEDAPRGQRLHRVPLRAVRARRPAHAVAAHGGLPRAGAGVRGGACGRAGLPGAARSAAAQLVPAAPAGRPRHPGRRHARAGA